MDWDRSRYTQAVELGTDKEELGRELFLLAERWAEPWVGPVLTLRDVSEVEDLSRHLENLHEKVLSASSGQRTTKARQREERTSGTSVLTRRASFCSSAMV